MSELGARQVLRCPRCQRYMRRPKLCVRCDLAQPLLRPLAEPLTRYCVHCGHAYEAYVGTRSLTCSPRCNTARWRAIGKLAGTHGTVKGRWKRLVQGDA